MRAQDRPVGDVWMQSIQEILTEWNSVDGGVAGSPESWEWLLNDKRDGDQYSQALNFLREEGFTRPVTCNYEKYSGTMKYGDGHHRLAAAIDLGMTHIPIVKCLYWGDLAHNRNLDGGEYAGTSDKFRKLISESAKAA